MIQQLAPHFPSPPSSADSLIGGQRQSQAHFTGEIIQLKEGDSGFFRAWSRTPALYKQCKLGHIPSPPWASVFTSVKWVMHDLLRPFQPRLPMTLTHKLLSPSGFIRPPSLQGGSYSPGILTALRVAEDKKKKGSGQWRSQCPVKMRPQCPEGRSLQCPEGRNLQCPVERSTPLGAQ